MRQAGRYLPEYQAVRRRHSILEICKNVELAAEVTILPVEKLGVDAAIIFADLLLPVEPMGLQLHFAAGEGPVVDPPVRTLRDVKRLRTDGADQLGFVGEAIRRVGDHCGNQIPVIGFAGAPFTLASYMIEGGGSRNYIHTKSMMYSQPQAWHQLMEKLCGVLETYLLDQVGAGAAAIQLFDSWVGCLHADDYKRYVLPYSRRLVQVVESRGVPVIHFGTGTAGMLQTFASAGSSVLGLDWRVPLDQAWREVGYRPAVQGNLDPVALLAPWPELRQRVRAVLDQAGGRSGHIFNLGHGILPGTPVKNVKAVVDMVHDYTSHKRLRQRRPKQR
jgi:uroporphyrinogen decarboxylase